MGIKRYIKAIKRSIRVSRWMVSDDITTEWKAAGRWECFKRALSLELRYLK